MTYRIDVFAVLASLMALCSSAFAGTVGGPTMGLWYNAQESGRGYDIEYRLTPRGTATLAAFGADLPAPTGRRPFVGYCVDWSEQRHHLAGAVGAAILDRMLELAWIVRQPRGRAVGLTPAGADGLRETFAFEPETSCYAASARPRTSGSISSAGTGLLNR